MFGNGNHTDPSTLTFTLDIVLPEQGVDGWGRGGVVTMVMDWGSVSAVVLCTGTVIPPYGYGIIGGVLGVALVAVVVILVVAVVTRCWYRRRNARAVIGKVSCCHMTTT